MALAGGVSTPEGKRSFGNLFMTGAALAVTFLLASDGRGWLGYTALVSMLLAWLLFHLAGQQERSEATARDRIEWLREAIRFRRAVAHIWKRLDGWPFNTFAGAIGFKGTLEHLLDGAGWPDSPGDTAPHLTTFLTCCLLPPGAETIIPGPSRSSFRHLVPQEDLIAEWQAVKDILEVWSVALDLGGSRAPALREVIRRLSDNHVNSVRLVWFLSIAHTAYKPPPSEADYTFVRRVRDVMVDAS